MLLSIHLDVNAKRMIMLKRDGSEVYYKGCLALRLLEIFEFF